MKKSIIIVCVLLISVSAFSQQQQRRGIVNRTPEPVPVVFTPKNEWRVNLPATMIGLYPEITYERIFREDLSFGLTVGFLLGDATNNFYEDLRFNFTPHFRWYFGGNRPSANRPGAGFFIEANAAIIYRDIYRWRWDREDNLQLGAGLGSGIGWKYVSTNNWVGEFMFGIGRDFVNDDIIPRFGLSIGRRF